MAPTGVRQAESCDGVRELVVWHPTAVLDEGERRRVETHVATCAACADLLRFASEIQGAVAAEAAVHPEAEALVRFAEDRAALDAGERARLAAHVAGCRRCAEEVAILGAVDRDESTAGLRREPSRSPAGAGLAAPFRAVWDRLAATLLRPVPAAVYLAAAAVAIAVVVTQPGGDGVAPRPGSRVDGVVLLPGETSGSRGAPRDAPPVPRSAGARTQFLLLELTDLEAAPRAGERYGVVVTPEGSAAPAWEGDVVGEAFTDTYSLGLVLEAGTLAPGRYDVSVVAPGGETIYRSPLAVE
jgi:hypothetical protein